MHLIAVGRLKTGPEMALFERYAARLRPKLAVTEVAEGRGAPGEIKRREADALLAAIPAKCLAVALDLGAAQLSSEGFAQALERWIAGGKPVVFLIGGAEGLAQTVIDRADHTMSLGALTWPHMLVRVMLAEQLFRAQSIAAGHPYHRAGRPES